MKFGSINRSLTLLISIVSIIALMAAIYCIIWITKTDYDILYRNEPSDALEDLEIKFPDLVGEDETAKLPEGIADSIGRAPVFIKRDIFGSDEYIEGEPNVKFRLAYTLEKEPKYSFQMPGDNSKIGLINEDEYPWLFNSVPGEDQQYDENGAPIIVGDPQIGSFENACSIWRIKEVYEKQYLIVNNRFPATCMSGSDPSHTSIDNTLMFSDTRITHNLYEFVNVPGASGKYLIRKVGSKSYLRAIMGYGRNNKREFGQLLYGTKKKATKFSIETALASSLDANPSMWPIVKYSKPIMVNLYSQGGMIQKFLKIKTNGRGEAQNYNNASLCIFYGPEMGTWLSKNKRDSSGEYVGFNVRGWSAKISNGKVVNDKEIKFITDVGEKEMDNNKMWIGPHYINTPEESYDTVDGGKGFNLNYVTFSYLTVDGTQIKEYKAVQVGNSVDINLRSQDFAGTNIVGFHIS